MKTTLALLLMLPLVALAAGDPHALMTAARSGDRAAMNAQLRAGVSADAAEPGGMRALHYVVERDDVPGTRLLLAAKADPRAATHLGVTPLQIASLRGHVPTMGLLLEAGADVNGRDLAGETMLMAAARSGSADAVRLLLRAGAELEATEPQFEQTALILAARSGEGAVAALIAAGAKVGARTRTGPVPPFRPAGGTRGKGVEKSPARGARPAIPGGKTALHYATRDGHLGVVRLLLDAGAPVDEADPNEITPLLFAITNDRVAVARLLIERGANIDAGDWYGRTPLWAAIDVRNRDTPIPAEGTGSDREGNLELVRALLARGAKPDPRIREMPVVRSHLLPLGSLSWVDFTGETPFIRAALAGDVVLMRLLMAHGADPKLATSGGTTSLAAAAGVNWTVAQTFDLGPEALLEAVRICHEAGVDVNAPNSLGIRAIHGAANRGSDDIVKFLAEHGADLAARDSEGRTPLDWANGVFLATHPPQPRPTTIDLLQHLLAAK